jgi:hypothetical protein
MKSTTQCHHYGKTNAVRYNVCCALSIGRTVKPLFAVRFSKGKQLRTISTTFAVRFTVDA